MCAWALLRWSIGTILVAQDLADVFNVVVVLEALLAAFLADVLVATSAFGRIASGLEFLTGQFLIQLWVDLVHVDLVHILNKGCIACKTRSALRHTSFKVLATGW